MSGVIPEIAYLIEKQSGFVIGEQSYPALDQFAQRRVERGRFADLEGYVDYLRRHPDSEEWRHILSEITIKESYLFRGNAQFEALAKIVLEEIAGRDRDRRLRVWCAGCARGEEAVTLAIVLADHPVIGSWSWSILATDVDESALADARNGLYGERAVERVPRAAMARYFSRRGSLYELDGQLLGKIEYRRLNLIDEPLNLGGETFDVVFLRNVLIYFRPELQRRVVESVEGLLDQEGTLFLGPSESLIHLGTTLQARDLGGCFCYRRSAEETAVTSRDEQAERPLKPLRGDLVAPPRTTEEERQVVPFRARLESALMALETEEIGIALTALEALRQEKPESAVVHALEGIALERTGQAERSVLAYRAALYLAPEMDEVRFLLARALEGLGRSRAATREYRTALSGLGPSSRLLAEFRRIGLPGHDEMSQACREFLIRI